ncbi:MAG TPA: hypothetical protein VNU49_05025 [Opitutaceae bacterium]|nr:hypothetical protein [Opitutaceae bacterium]
MSCLRRTPSFLTRLVAGAGIALVLLLNVLAACPAAHEWIHGHGEHAAHDATATGSHHPDADEDGCVVTLFAHGVITATIFAALIVALFRLVAVPARPGEALCLSVPRYWLPPLCGPPQS